MPKKIMVQCATRINKDSISRTNIGGVEHIIVSSTTLPDNVVMNGLMYPAEEIAKGFKTLERTLAPVEHPVDAQGNFLMASDPEAIHNFHAGAYNTNVRQEGGRVHIDKTINVQEALKSERGKRLLDRVNELETSDSPRPIHTSVGLFLEVEALDTPQTNADGDEFSGIGRNFMFDHDAILLDSVAAATPEKGVGMAVNAEGDQVEVERVVLDPTGPERQAKDSRINAEGMSFSQVQEQLQQKINGIVTADWLWLVDVFDGEAIFETPQGFFMVPWNMNAQGLVELAGIPIRVIKEVKFTPKVNADGGNGKMKEKILKVLKEAGVDVKDLTDDQLFAKHNELLTANATTAAEEAAKEAAKVAAAAASGDDKTGIGEAITNAIKPLVEKIDGLETKINAGEQAKIDEMATLVGNSDKYPGIDVEKAKTLDIDMLKTMAANCQDSFGIGFSANHDGNDGFAAPADMPE